MAAPTPTVRGTPVGWKMPEGFRSLITFAADSDISFWEREVTPPGIDGLDPIDVTTQHNSVWVTKEPRQLKDIPPFTVQVAYDPDYLPDIRAMVNRKDTVTIRYPNGSTDALFAYLQKFEPDSLKIGEFPMATLTIVATNKDASGAEFGPVHTPAAGT